MVARKACAVLTALVALGFGLQPSFAAAACDLQVGQEVVLASMSPDPDVFVWDTRTRLIDYAAGIFDDAKSVMAHTTLAKPGTHAIVAMCATGVIRPKYLTANYDAVGIKVISGPYKGRWGWIASDDAHLVQNSAARTRRARPQQS
ncbi:MAG: hypothetical protein JO359_10470 [Candidatus Eremiobacteraeota bacterium]|nr:hypothetical protein [Candidatus Eremiobacteraeota bacterium]